MFFKKIYRLLVIFIVAIVLAAIIFVLIFLVPRLKPDTKAGTKDDSLRLEVCQTEIDCVSINSSLSKTRIFQHEIFIELPESLLFCGQEFPLTCYSDSLQFYKAMAYFLDRPHLIWTYMMFFGRYLPHVEKILQDNGLPDDLKYVPIVESSLSLRAKSWAGAVGYWQFIKSTALKYRLTVTQEVDQRLDPILAGQAAARYFKDLYDEFGDWTLVLAAYNAGEGRIRRALKEHRALGDSLFSLSLLPLAGETQAYPFLIVAFKIIYENSELYHLSMPFPVEPLEFDTVTVRIKKKTLTFSEIASVCGVPMPAIRDLNPVFLKGKIPSGKWIICLPRGTRETFLAKFSQ